MAVANRIFGPSISSMTLAGHSVIQFFKSIDLDTTTEFAVAFSPNDSRLSTDPDSAGQDGWEFPRPTARNINLGMTLMIPGESTLVASIVQDSAFDTALAKYDTSIAFAFNIDDESAAKNLPFSGTGVASQGSLDFPGEEGTTMIQLEARSFAFGPIGTS